MQGFVNKAIQNFVFDLYGRDRWAQVTHETQLGISRFETLLDYDPVVLERVMRAVTGVLDQPQETWLEDLGHYLVSHPKNEALRRLLRFSGANFVEFVLSLDELRDRVQFVAEDIELPDITLAQPAPNAFDLTVQQSLPGYLWVLVGVLRAMADDYGALALIDCDDGGATGVIHLTVADSGFAAGRHFNLAPQEVPLAG